MSALGGMYSRDGSPLNKSVLKRLNYSLRDMGPDGSDFVSLGDVSMFCRPFYTERQAQKTTHVNSEQFIVALDGRIDNPQDLAYLWKELKEFEVSWPRLILAVYRKFGVEGFARIIGDFSFAFWDPLQKTLILGCDSLGRRPLYYCSTPSYVAWASRSRPLAEALGLGLQVDEEYVADFLVNMPSEGSPYKPIRRVPGGQALVANSDRLELRQYWIPGSQKSIRYRDDEQYQEHFKSLFVEAVRCRIATKTPVFCELSGGLDSSAIACTAASIVRDQAHSGAKLFTVSYVFEHSRTSDERHFISLVEQQLQGKGLHIDDQECPMLAWPSEPIRPDLPTNGLVFVARHDRLAREMLAKNSRVLLNGIGGDQLFWSEPPVILPLLDMLSRRQLSRFFEEAKHCSRMSGWPYLMTLWRSVGTMVRGQVVVNNERRPPIADWFNPTFIRRTGLRDRAHPSKDNKRNWLPSSAAEWALIRQTMRIYALERFLSKNYIDVRYPYLDRRLVEFSLAIPLEQKLRAAETRSIVRRAWKGVVPEAICNRVSKAGPDEAFYRAIIREWPSLSELCSRLRAADYGFVDAKRFVNGLRSARHGMAPSTVQIMRTIALELWLRSLERECTINRKEGISTVRDSIGVA